MVPQHIQKTDKENRERFVFQCFENICCALPCPLQLQTKKRVVVCYSTEAYRDAAVHNVERSDVCLEVGCHEGKYFSKCLALRKLLDHMKLTCASTPGQRVLKNTKSMVSSPKHKWGRCLALSVPSNILTAVRLSEAITLVAGCHNILQFGVEHIKSISMAMCTSQVAMFYLLACPTLAS